MARVPERWQAPTIGLGVVVVLVVAAIAVPALTGWNVWANHFPPLHAEWSPHLGPGTAPAIVLAILAARHAADAATGLTWRRLLAAVFVTALLWLVSLALVDGPSGLGAILDSSHEYLRTARAITDVSATLHEYIARIPLDAPNNWPTHVAGHPPGAVLFFWGLVRLGLGGWPTAGAVVTLAAATTPLAVLITLRRLGAEPLARTAAPFLVLGPSAIWSAVSADALFAAVAAWALCALAIAGTATGVRRRAGWALLSGLLLGCCAILSYGLPLLGVLALAVILLARSWGTLPWAILGGLAVLGAFAVAGFAYGQAYPVLVERYWAGIATRRPAGYWIWGNLAALGISAGPVVGAGVAVALARTRRWREQTSGMRVVVVLALAALLCVVLADGSQMSKAEVERIWLPFIPWLLVATALLPPRWRHAAFVGQLGFAILVQHVLFTGW